MILTIYTMTEGHLRAYFNCCQQFHKPKKIEKKIIS